MMRSGNSRSRREVLRVLSSTMIHLLDIVLTIVGLIISVSFIDLILLPEQKKRFEGWIDDVTLKLEFVVTADWFSRWLRRSIRANIMTYVVSIIILVIFFRPELPFFGFQHWGALIIGIILYLCL
jgi:hypothetical protein